MLELHADENLVQGRRDGARQSLQLGEGDLVKLVGLDVLVKVIQQEIESLSGGLEFSYAVRRRQSVWEDGGVG